MSVKKINHNIFIIFAIFCFALFFRLFGLNWDQNQHLHPDERFLTMLVSTIKTPDSLIEYFDTNNSSLNPFNYDQFNFFVYGTFPLFLTKYLGQTFNLVDYNKIHLLGRVLSAIFDSLNVFSLYFLAKLFYFKNKKYLLFLPSLFYSFAVLPIQLSHFFTVDTFLTFFLLLSFVFLAYWIKKQKNIYLFYSSIVFALAISCKISAILFLPIIFIFFIYQFFSKKYIPIKEFLIFSIISFLVFRFFQPYSFVGFIKINPELINSLNYLKSILLNKDVFYPPEIQWLSKTVIIYPFQNIILWGLGLPLSLFFLFSLKNIFNLKIKRIFYSSSNFIILSALLWTLFLFFQQGFQFTHTMRYFLPIYPFICFLSIPLNNFSKTNIKLIIIVLFFHLLYATIFISIYTRPHSRVQASNWIYQNISSESVLSNEYWDDPLPLSNPNYSKFYSIELLNLYDPDTPEKWEQINSILTKTDYLLLTSNRLWSSITSVPDRYPLSTEYYQKLFDGQSDFKKIIEFNSYPGISLPFLNKCIYIGPTNFPYLINKNNYFEVDKNCFYPGIYLRDDIAEEAFTVYDHPKVIIFRKED
ncbi:MAG: glycosyltransferase family 39 protein [Candidatus Shapirobacteria bacterium]